VLGTVLLIGVAIAAWSVFYPLYVQGELKDKEADHAREVDGRVLELQSLIGRMSEAGDGGQVGIPMSAGSVPLYPAGGMAGCVEVSPADVETFEVIPRADGYVVENLPDGAYGSEPVLRVASWKENNSRSYLRFSLADLPEEIVVFRAELWLHCVQVESPAAGATDIRVYPVENDDWSEENLTWENQPATDFSPGNALDGTSVWEQGWVSLTVKDFVVRELGRGDLLVSFALRAAVEDYDNVERYVRFSSEEGEQPPRLLVVYSKKLESRTWRQVDWSGSETGIPPEVGTWPDDYDNYCLAESLAIGGDLRLAAGETSGYLESSVFDAGFLADWRTIRWDAETPSLVTGDNYSVDAEPDPLVDGSSRIGIALSPLADAQSMDGTYENIAEDYQTVTEYFYVRSETVHEGGTANFGGAKADDGNYENIFENNYVLELVSNGNFDGGYDGWTLEEIRSDGEAGYDGENSNTADGSGSIYISGSITGRWGGWQREEATWTQSIGPTSSTVTVNGAFRKDLFWESGLFPAEIRVATVRIELYDSGDGNWHTVYENIDVNYGDTGWIDFSPSRQYTPIEQVTRVRAHMYLQYRGGWTLFRNLTARGKIWVDDISVAIPAYRLDVEHSISGIPAADSYELQIEYYTAGDSEGVGLRLYDFSSGEWDEIATLQGGSEGSPNLFTYDLTGTGYVSGGGEVRVRYVQPDNDLARTSLMIDYARVKTEDTGYYLRWEHRVEGVGTYQNYRVRIYGCADPGEAFSIYTWDGTNDQWVDSGLNLPASPGWVEYSIPSSYLEGGNVCVAYIDDSGGDDVQDNIHIDYCAVEGTSVAETRVVVETRTGTDPNPYDSGWSAWEPCSNGGKVPSPDDRRYIQYRVRLESDDPSITPTFDNVVITCVSGGSESPVYGEVRVAIRDRIYPSYTYVLEGAAVVMIQGAAETMRSFPKMISVSEGIGGATEVEVTYVVIERRGAFISSAGTQVVRVTCVSSSTTVAPVGGLPNRENVVIDLDPRYTSAWEDYLREENARLARLGYNPSLDVGELRLTIEGKDTTPGVKDIYYRERFITIEVEVS